MEQPADLTALRKPGSITGRIFGFLSGLGLATVLLLLLGLLTWLATLEQIDKGLYPTLNKYFHWKSVWLLPELKLETAVGERWVMLPLPLPGGYWVGALLLLNLTLGGIIRIRKGWRHVGNLIAHFGIVMMLVAGGVAHHFSQRGHMQVSEGQTSNVAEDYLEYAVEVAEIRDGLPTSIHVIRGELLDDLTNDRGRVFRFPNLPFDLELAGYLTNALPVSVNEQASQGQREVDGYYLLARPGEIAAEANTAACYGRVVHRDDSRSEPFILAGASFHPFTVKIDDRVFTIDMRKRLWPMPFAIRLDEFKAEFHPGTHRPAKFVSKVARLEDGKEAPVTIQMNEPMRYGGLTFFQASYGPQGAGPGQAMYSVFEIVQNPADKWPEYSLYIVTFGMLITFLIKLGTFVAANSRMRNRHVES